MNQPCTQRFDKVMSQNFVSTAGSRCTDYYSIFNGQCLLCLNLDVPSPNEPWEFPATLIIPGTQNRWPVGTSLRNHHTNDTGYIVIYRSASKVPSQNEIDRHTSVNLGSFTINSYKHKLPYHYSYYLLYSDPPLIAP